MRRMISAARVITCRDENILNNAFIDIDDGTIKRVGFITNLTEEEKNTCVHYEDCTILPGLINAHEHLVTKTRITPGIFNDIKTEAVQLQILRAAKNANALLREGITTIRECGSREHININISKGIKSGFLLGPDILACGRPISITGGHCSYYSWQVNSIEDVVRAVRTELMSGADFIKVHATGGAGSLEGDPRLPELTFEELMAAVGEAHRAGKRVVSHAIGRAGIANSILAGVDSLEHGHYLDEQLLDLMAKNKTFYVPTLSGYVPLAMRGLEMGRPKWMVEKAKRLVDKHREAIEKVRKYPEIIVAAGTDSSGEMVEELELLISNGYNALEAIIFATRNAALTLGIEERVGTLDEGKQADILIVKGCPTENISYLRQIAEVIKKGRFIYH